MAFIGKQPGKAAITSTDITDGIITAAKLASDSVTTAKIADNGVTTAKINADAVTDAKIADDVVGSEHLTAGEVDTTALGADAVTAAKIADNAISEEHLDATVVTGLTALAAEPADTDEFLISDAGTLKRIDYSYIKGGGITMADQWRFTANTDNSSGSLGFDITSNLEQVDTAPQGTIGSAMSESSGIFTFPTTGFYFVKFNIQWQMNGDGDVRQGGGEMNWTTNNSSYSTIVDAYNGCNNHGLNYYSGAEMNAIVDITDTANQKVKFRAYNSASNATCMGSSSANHTYMTFIRLGDT
jgi:hypothetical protein